MVPETNCVLWFSGLSGSGKTTLSKGLQKRLADRGCQVVIFDGDIVRQKISRDLKFTPEDRTENLRRIAKAAADVSQYGIIVISAAISPYQMHRDQAQEIIGEGFHNIYIKANLEACQKRDPKGLYKKVEAGEIKNFTGVSDPFEEPSNPSLVIDTENTSVEECLDQLEAYVIANVRGETLNYCKVS